jgi:hypothetical protein
LTLSVFSFAAGQVSGYADRMMTTVTIGTVVRIDEHSITPALTSMVGLLLVLTTPAQESRQAVTRIVTQIQRADYEGDRAALKRLHAELSPFVADRDLGSRVLYWRGFARWRRALNGFNDAADPNDIDEDLTQCVTDFREAWARDAEFVDARIGAASCLANHSFLNLKTNRTRARELFSESTALFNEALAAAPENPRLSWAQGVAGSNPVSQTTFRVPG